MRDKAPVCRPDQGQTAPALLHNKADRRHGTGSHQSAKTSFLARAAAIAVERSRALTPSSRIQLPRQRQGEQRHAVNILVVDDESDVAELFRQRLRREVRQGTYTMHFASSGEEALEKLAGDIEQH